MTDNQSTMKPTKGRPRPERRTIRGTIRKDHLGRTIKGDGLRRWLQEWFIQLHTNLSYLLKVLSFLAMKATNIQWTNWTRHHCYPEHSSVCRSILELFVTGRTIDRYFPIPKGNLRHRPTKGRSQIVPLGTMERRSRRFHFEEKRR